jgi:hypothetical protein
MAAAGLWRSADSKQVLGITPSKWPTDIANLAQAARTGPDEECVSLRGNDLAPASPAPTITGTLAAT